jgi:outer membrane lipoprotein-sorting protein
MRTFVPLFAVAAMAAPARAADPTGPDVLAMVDRALNAFNDAVFESKLFVKQPDGQAREFAFTTYQKNPDKRLVRFNAPGDVKGMGVLIESKETMYVFLPGLQRVRRMGTHVKNQSFMGSDFSFEDMSAITYSHLYDSKLIGCDDQSWILDLTQKAGQDLEFPHLKLWSDKRMFQITRIEYYDTAGRNLKTQIRTEWRKDSPEHWQPYRVTVVDHRRNDHTSEIVFTNTRIDGGLGDDLFSVRSLVRGQ